MALDLRQSLQIHLSNSTEYSSSIFSMESAKWIICNAVVWPGIFQQGQSENTPHKHHCVTLNSSGWILLAPMSLVDVLFKVHITMIKRNVFFCSRRSKRCEEYDALSHHIPWYNYIVQTSDFQASFFYNQQLDLPSSWSVEPIALDPSSTVQSTWI